MGLNSVFIGLRVKVPRWNFQLDTSRIATVSTFGYNTKWWSNITMWLKHHTYVIHLNIWRTALNHILGSIVRWCLSASCSPSAEASSWAGSRSSELHDMSDAFRTLLLSRRLLKNATCWRHDSSYIELPVKHRSNNLFRALRTLKSDSFLLYI
jgi:hypothetical protein